MAEMPVWQFVRQYAASHGLPDSILVTLVLAESGGNPNANVIDSNQVASTGLLMLNQKGQGAGHTVKYLLDPRHNLDIGVPPIVTAYKEASKALTGYDLVAFVAGHSGHNSYDGEVDADLPQAWASYQAMVSGKLAWPNYVVTVPWWWKYLRYGWNWLAGYVKRGGGEF